MSPQGYIVAGWIIPRGRTSLFSNAAKVLIKPGRLKWQRRLTIRPIDHLEHHPALKQFGFEVSRVLLPFCSLSNAKCCIPTIPLQRVVGISAPRTPSYITVRLSFVNA